MVNFKENKGEFIMKTENLDKIIFYKNEKLVIFQIGELLTTRCYLTKCQEFLRQ